MVANLAEINYSSEKSFIFPRSFSKHKDQREINFSQTNYVGSDNIDYLDLLLKYMPENNTGKPFYVYSYDIEASSYHYRHYTSRISELNELAEEEDIHPIKDESKKDFFEFFRQLSFPVRKGNLALSDDGILSITWLNKQWRLSLNTVALMTIRDNHRRPFVFAARQRTALAEGVAAHLLLHASRLGLTPAGDDAFLEDLVNHAGRPVRWGGKHRG